RDRRAGRVPDHADARQRVALGLVLAHDLGLQRAAFLVLDLADHVGVRTVVHVMSPAGRGRAGVQTGTIDAAQTPVRIIRVTGRVLAVTVARVADPQAVPAALDRAARAVLVILLDRQVVARAWRPGEDAPRRTPPSPA